MGSVCSSPTSSSSVHPSHSTVPSTVSSSPKVSAGGAVSSASIVPTQHERDTVPSTAATGVARPSASKDSKSILKGGESSKAQSMEGKGDPQSDGPSRSNPTHDKKSRNPSSDDQFKLMTPTPDGSRHSSPQVSAKHNVKISEPANTLQKAFTFSGTSVERAATFNEGAKDTHSGGIMKKGSKKKSKDPSASEDGTGTASGDVIERLQTDVGVMSLKSKSPLGSPRGGRRRKSEENPSKGEKASGDGKNSGKKKHKRKGSNAGMMSKLALQFPQIRKSFMAVYTVFERYMTTRNRIQRRGSTVEYKDLGNITIDRLGQVLEAITTEYGHRPFGEDEIRDLFHLADLDGSKTISFREFLIAVAIGYFLKYDFPDELRFIEIQRGFKHVERAFKEMDDDGSNSVDAEELKHALFSASDGANNAILEARFKELDFNDDGDVSLPEFMYCMVSWVGFVEDSEDAPDEDVKKEARETPRVEEKERDERGTTSPNRVSPRTPALNLSTAAGSGPSSPRAKSARSSGDKPISILKTSPIGSPVVTRQKSDADS